MYIYNTKMDESKMLSEKFDLAESISELPPINDGVVKPQYRQVNCQKSIEGTAFASGQQSFRFNVSGSTWWDPTKTYFSFRVRLAQQTDGFPITALTGYAPAMGLISNLYQSIELRMGGKVVQRISQFVPQCDSLITRATRSGSWMDQFGESVNFWASEYAQRQGESNRVPGNPGNTTRFELCWKPPLMLFHTCDKYLPSGDYELVLNPQPESQYRLLSFEAGAIDPIPNYGNNAMSIDRVHLNVATVEGPRMDNGKFALSLEHIECQSNKLLSANLSQTNFSVSSATKALVVAYQDQRLNTGEMSSSKYTISEDANPQTGTPNPDNRIGALKLTRLYVQYDGLQRPSPDADPSVTTTANTGKYEITERYYETMAETGLMYDDAGPESIQDWVRRGPYYYFNWNRDSRSGATRVVVNQEFSSQNAVDNGNVLLFAISETSAEITVRNGSISDVVQVER